MKRLTIAVLFSLTLQAQTAVSPVEQSYGPYERPGWGGRPALAASRTRVLLAWSEGVPAARIRTGLLDRNGRLVTPLVTLPVAGTENVENVAPAAASDGTSFFLVWLEWSGSAELLRGAAVSANGEPGVVRTYGSGMRFTSDPRISPRVAWDGAAYRVWSGSRVYSIAPDGETLSSQASGPQEVAFAAANGVVARARAIHQPLWAAGSYEHVYVEWTVGARTGLELIAEWRPRLASTVSTPNITPAAGDFAVAWSAYYGVGYLVTRGLAPVTTVNATPRLDVPPGLACDDDECLVAYGTLGGDVQAFLFDSDRPRGPVLFPIATTERKESAPQVHALGPGRFLVAYLSDQGTDQRLNGRIVITDPVRRRAVR